MNIESIEWFQNFRLVLCDAGFSKPESLAIQYAEFGRTDSKINISTCPFCIAKKYLLKRGFIPKRHYHD